MSKESYVRGFVKEAEAHGVDPVALAKFAQQYKTDGYAPKPVSEHGKETIPHYHTPSAHSNNPDAGLVGELESANDLDMYNNYLGENGYSHNPLAEIYIKNNPRYSTWFGAHTNSVGEATKLIASPLYRDARKGVVDANSAFFQKNPYLMRLAGKIYHDKMLSLTGTPTRVSSTITKE